MPPETQDFDDNTSSWLLGGAPYAPEAPLQGDQRADVVIVGGGFTGTSTAWHLSARFPDRRIVLLEARTLANGASGRSGGQMLHWMNGVSTEDPELVRRVYEATDRGVRWIVDTIREHALPVRYAYEGTFELYTDAKRAEEAARRTERLRSWGIELQWMDRAQLASYLNMEGVVGGAFDSRTGMLNGADFVRALKPLLLARGVSIYENTRVTRIAEGRTIEVETTGGRVRAPALVLATNAYTATLGYFKDRIFPLHSHMVATDPLEAPGGPGVGWRPGVAFCDDLDRIAFGGLAPGGCLVFGGGSNASYTYRYGGPTALAPAEHARAFQAVERRLRGYAPRLEGVPLPHRWSGPLGITLNRQCTMGVQGEHRNVFYALGYSGHGVALANLAGMVLTDLYSDHHEPWADQPFYQNTLPWIPPEPLRWTGYHVVTGLTGRSPRSHS